MWVINVGIKINYCKAAKKITYGTNLWNDYLVTTHEDTVQKHVVMCTIKYFIKGKEGSSDLDKHRFMFSQLIMSSLEDAQMWWITLNFNTRNKYP